MPFPYFMNTKLNNWSNKCRSITHLHYIPSNEAKGEQIEVKEINENTHTQAHAVMKILHQNAYQHNIYQK